MYYLKTKMNNNDNCPSLLDTLGFLVFPDDKMNGPLNEQISDVATDSSMHTENMSESTPQELHSHSPNVNSSALTGLPTESSTLSDTESQSPTLSDTESQSPTLSNTESQLSTLSDTESQSSTLSDTESQSPLPTLSDLELSSHSSSELSDSESIQLKPSDLIATSQTGKGKYFRRRKSPRTSIKK